MNARLRLLRPGPPSPAGRTAPSRLAWSLVVALGILIGVVVPLLAGGCAQPREPTMVQTDEERCAAKGGYWTWLPSRYAEGQWHCLARRP